MREFIKNARIERGISVDDIAKTLSVSDSMVWKVEAGIRNPSVPLARKWAEILSIQEKDILRYFFDNNSDIMSDGRQAAGANGLT